MFKPHQDRDLLVVRPWTTHYSGTDSYGHFDAIVMRQRGLRIAERYGDLDVLHRGDSSGKGPLLDGFRFECQIDERRPEAYACRWGYAGNQSGLFTADDLARYGKSIAAIERGLRRAAETDGETDSVGHLVVRLARILRIDGIVILETRFNGSFGAGLSLRYSSVAPAFGTITSRIDGLQHELQAACQAASRRCAA